MRWLTFELDFWLTIEPLFVDLTELFSGRLFEFKLLVALDFAEFIDDFSAFVEKLFCAYESELLGLTELVFVEEFSVEIELAAFLQSNFVDFAR